MSPRLVGMLVDAAIPILGGVYLTLLGMRVVGKRPGASEKYDAWHARYGSGMTAMGVILILMTLARVGATASGPPALSWARHAAADGRCSLEFPGSPTRDAPVAGGVVHQRLRLPLPSVDADYSLIYSDTPDATTMPDEERLDAIRDMALANRQANVTFRLVREAPLTPPLAPGREIELAVNETHTMLSRVALRGARVYRAVVVVPRGEELSLARRCLDSMRIDP
jgi:hypothetical protein